MVDRMDLSLDEITKMKTTKKSENVQKNPRKNKEIDANNLKIIAYRDSKPKKQKNEQFGVKIIVDNPDFKPEKLNIIVPNHSFKNLIPVITVPNDSPQKIRRKRDSSQRFSPYQSNVSRAKQQTNRVPKSVQRVEYDDEDDYSEVQYRSNRRREERTRQKPVKEQEVIIQGSFKNEHLNYVDDQRPAKVSNNGGYFVAKGKHKPALVLAEGVPDYWMDEQFQRWLSRTDGVVEFKIDWDRAGRSLETAKIVFESSRLADDAVERLNGTNGIALKNIGEMNFSL
eukprot:TRINITY_DN7239_c0_g1_i1.p1 TRINITY_DN7239_c0_g1~~TRINITY_DN7239_c0_g1_i1.p1  ORF type:complete len:283 (+),score=60.97 TRINITY_DN7239_c0_g1_i1:64-912(+)